jgi:predicted dehydrogenase
MAAQVSDRIRLGLIGCGFFAQNHLHSWQDLKPEGVDIVAVCDSDPARAKAAAETFGVPQWYTDAAEMFEKEQLGLVDIATTMGSHLSLVLLALSHRVPTIVQKPFGEDIAQVRQMVEASESAGVFLAVHENFRFQKPLRKIREVIESGAIGRPTWARISFRTGYDIYAGQPYLAKQERFVVIDVGVHVLDVARALLGEVTHSTAELQGRNPIAIGEDTATMLLRHESGAVSVVECTYGSRRVPDSFPETLIEVEGDRGAIVSRIGNVVEVTIDGKMTSYDEDPEVLPWAARPWHVAQESVLATCRHMLEAVKAGRPAATSAADNLKTFALVEAAYEAAGKLAPAR